MTLKKLLVLLFFFPSLAYAQVNGGVSYGVSVSGPVTPNDCVKFLSPWVIQDSGSTCGGGGGSGTVTSVSVATANGFSGTVTNPTTTPAITIIAGAITPTSVNGLTITNSTGTLTIANGVTLTANNTLTFTGTNGSSVNFGAGGTVLYSGGAVTSFTGDGTILNNSASTGAVTATLANAAANTVLGNATTGAAAPTYTANPFVSTISLGTNTTTNAINITGQSAQTINMVRDVTAATAGQNLTVQAGGAVSAGTDLSGGNLILSSGISTGTGTSQMQFKTFPAAGSTGSADNTATTAMTILGNGHVGIGVTNPLAGFAVSTTVSSSTQEAFSFLSTVNGNPLSIASFYASALTAGEQTFFSVGKQNNSQQAGTIGFTLVADSSAANYMTLGINGTASPLNILKSTVGVGTNSPLNLLDVNGTADFTQFVGRGAAPAIAVGAAAGSGATASIAAGGTNLGGQITVATGTGTTSGAVLATITFAGTVTTAPKVCTLTPQNTNAVGQVAMVYTTQPSTTIWTISIGGSAIPASTSSFVWGYICGG